MTQSFDCGARWLRCDLHVHTPFDGEKRFGEDIQAAIRSLKDSNSSQLKAIASRLLEACKHAADGEGIDLIALTDHNSIEGYRHLSTYFESDDRPSVPIVLPGVEFSVGGERPVHILVIFERKTNIDHIDGAINYVFGTSERFDPKSGTPRSTGQSVPEFLDHLYDYCLPDDGQRRMKFLVIPAHADSGSGIAKELLGASIKLHQATSWWEEMKGHLRQRVISRKDWHAFQTRRRFDDLPEAFQELLCRWIAERRSEDWDTLTPDERKRYRSLKHWPLIQCSDPHNYETVGKGFTWMKMAVPDVEGIRLALLDPQSRLRTKDEGPPICNYPHIERLQVQNTDFYEEIDVRFNPCLTTIIGGRGSGKSTILEYLRLALDRARQEDLPEGTTDSTRNSVQSVLKSKSTRDFGNSPGTLLPDYCISIELAIAGSRYKVTRSEDGFEITSLSVDGAPKALQLDVRSILVPRILSQKQIAEIAKNPKSQRAELDALVEREVFNKIEEERRSLLAEFTRLQSIRSQLSEKKKTLPSIQTTLQTVSDQIEFLKSEGREETLADYEAFERQRRWLTQERSNLRETVKRIEEEAGTIEQSVGEIQLPEPQETPRTWIGGVAERIRSELMAAASALSEQGAELHELESQIALEQSVEWQSKYDAAKTAYEELAREMSTRDIDFSQHQRLIQRKAQLEQEIKTLQVVHEEIASNEKKLLDTWQDLIATHVRRLDARNKLALVLEEKDADVRLEIQPFADRDDFENRREQWFAGSGLREDDWKILCEYIFDPQGNVPERITNLASAMRKDMELVGELSTNPQQFELNVAELVSANGSLTRGFTTALKRRDRIHVDEMERFLPEDLVLTKVRSADGTFKTIEAGSVGEKSTSILSLLLSSGDDPIIIDQPEDDLDNRYVYSVVVDLLRRQKFSRQVIVATHNANIPVNGDAELIVALDARDGLGRVGDSGSIDEPQMKKSVSEIMEGSAEAFRLRKERYGY